MWGVGKSSFLGEFGGGGLGMGFENWEQGLEVVWKVVEFLLRFETLTLL